MKTEGKVRHQLSQVIFRYRKKAMVEGLAPLPHNCVHNRRLGIFGKTLGACGYMEGTPEANRAICDTNVCPDQARTCPYFRTIHTPEALKESFQQHFGALLAQAQLGHLGYLAHHYPDVAALLWVLEEDPQQTTVEHLLEESKDYDSVATPPHPTPETGDGQGPPTDGGSS